MFAVCHTNKVEPDGHVTGRLCLFCMDKPEAAGTWIYGRNSPNYYGTCRLHGVNPEAWLTDVLNRLPDTKTEDLHLLLPGAWLPTGQH